MRVGLATYDVVYNKTISKKTFRIKKTGGTGILPVITGWKPVPLGIA